MKVYELAKELGLSPDDVRRTGKQLGIKVTDATTEMTAADAKKLRSHIAESGVARLSDRPEPEAVAAEPDVAPLPSLPPVQLHKPTGRKCRGVGAADIRLHADLLDWLAERDQPPVLLKRVRLVLEQIHSHGQPHKVKMTSGANEGWRRTPLGGHGGNHYYLWWTPAGAPPAKHLDLDQGCVLARAVRHHDATDQYLPADGDSMSWSPQDLLDSTDHDLPYGELQVEFSADSNSVKVLQGHPGAGKTTTLHLAARRCPPGRLVYVTWSARLAAEAREALLATVAADVDFVVLTWAEVLDELAPLVAARVPTDQAIAQVQAALDQWQVRSVWKDDAAGSYAELYSNWVGTALPFEFDDLAGSADGSLDKNRFMALREEAVGVGAARQFAEFAQRLAPADLDGLCSEPRQAFRALERLRSGSQPAPAVWAGAQMVLVDEVQDFTLVELACLVELVAVTAQSAGRLPHVVLAGDEGQTVRPTDFEWGRLNRLLNRRLSVAPKSLELPGNVRSPRVIAGLVNRSWSLYGGIAKRERPRGRSEAEIEEVELGHVLHCVPGTDQEFARLAHAISRMPGAQWVHPGHHVPAAIRELCPDVMTTAEAKGCGFSVVGLADVSQHFHLLAQLSKQGQSGNSLSQTNARTLADQLRVALSRSTDTLVLVDRAGRLANDFAELCSVDGRLDDGVRLNMDVDAVIRELEGLATSAEERVQAWLDDARQRLADDPVRALLRADWACGALGREGAPGAVSDGALRREAYRIAGVSSVLAALLPNCTDAAVKLELAQRSFERAGIPVGKALAADWANLLKNDSPSAVLALANALRRPEVRQVGELTSKAETSLLDWSRRATTRWSGNIGLADQIDFALVAVLEVVPQRRAELTDRRDALADAAASRALEQKNGQTALKWLAKRSTRRPGQEARAFELLGDMRSAADAWEDSGEVAQALRCLRNLPGSQIDFARAHGLAQRCGDVEAERAMSTSLAFLQAVESVRTVGPLLSEEERKQLSSRVAAALGDGSP